MTWAAAAEGGDMDDRMGLDRLLGKEEIAPGNLLERIRDEHRAWGLGKGKAVGVVVVLTAVSASGNPLE